MDGQVRIRRSRGAVCGIVLILLGLWGGLAPFVGPYFHFGVTPDKAWDYTTGRLYLSAVPGGVAALCGIAIALTRSRYLAVPASVLAAVAGAWFVAGSGITQYLLKQTSISAGTPLQFSGSGPYTVRAYLEVLALFGGTGALIIFAAALAAGRVSILAIKDAADTSDAGYYPEYQPASASLPEPGGYPSAQFPTTSAQFPTTSAQFPADFPTTSSASTGPFPTASGQFPASSGRFPTAAGQFPPTSDQYTQPSSLPTSGPPFPDSPNPVGPDSSDS
jgi:hypothetical protein